MQGGSARLAVPQPTSATTIVVRDGSARRSGSSPQAARRSSAERRAPTLRSFATPRRRRFTADRAELRDRALAAEPEGEAITRHDVAGRPLVAQLDGLLNVGSRPGSQRTSCHVTMSPEIVGKRGGSPGGAYPTPLSRLTITMPKAVPDSGQTPTCDPDPAVAARRVASRALRLAVTATQWHIGARRPKSDVSSAGTLGRVGIVTVLVIAAATTFVVHALGVVVAANWFRPRLARVVEGGFFGYALFVAMSFPYLILASVLLSVVAWLAGFAAWSLVLGFHATVALYFGGAGLLVGIQSLWEAPLSQESLDNRYWH